MTKQEREKRKEELKHLKREVNQAKSRLIEILSRVEVIDAGSARSLGSIIGRLEHWQNT